MDKKNLLPFEKIKREIFVKKKEKTDVRFGKLPSERTVEELINFGIVNIDKPAGPTSHQVSAYTKQILGIDKAGHSGTLDPNVTGLLPTALARGTRVVQTLLSAGKEYVCLMHLHKEVSKSKIEKVMMKEFVGKLKQLPPIKSAIKREWRYRKVYYIEILEIKGQDVLFRIGTQAGTYIRKICLHPSTEILTTDSVSLAKDFFINPKTIYSMNNKKIETKIPSQTQKFIFEGDLLKITMSSGVSFTMTPDHRMLISAEDGYIMKRAETLKTTDYIVKSLNYELPEKEIILADLLDDSYLVDQEDIREKVKQAFLKKYGSIREMNRQLGLDRKAFLKNSKFAIPISHIKKAGIYEKIKSKIKHFKTEKGTKIYLSKLNEDLLYLIGLIASDGNNTKEKGTIRRTRIKFHNKEEALIDVFIKKYKKSFPNFNISKNIKNNNFFELDTSNSFFATICASLGIKSPQKNSDIFPIINLDKKLIASFLKGYFDGDGTVYYKEKIKTKGVYSRIDYFTVNKTDAKRIHQMLLKLNISNVIVKKKDIYVIVVNDVAAKKRFISIVGTNHPRKKEKMNKILTIDSDKINENLYAGYHFKKNIENNKSKLYNMGGNLSRIINSNIPMTRGFYKKASKIVKLPALDDFQIEKIKKIEKINYKGPVYDMTVPDTHNFLMETGFVSSNCHDIGTALGCGAHMAELRRTKVGPFNESTLTTLQELSDNLYFYKEKGDDSGIRKNVFPIEFAVRHIPKIWVFDTTVNSLCHGANLKIPGISKLETETQIDEDVAIMTLKDELIAIGKVKMLPKQIMKEKKGIAVKIDRVFMIPDTYPRIDKS